MVSLFQLLGVRGRADDDRLQRRHVDDLGHGLDALEEQRPELENLRRRRVERAEVLLRDAWAEDELFRGDAPVRLRQRSVRRLVILGRWCFEHLANIADLITHRSPQLAMNDQRAIFVHSEVTVLLRIQRFAFARKHLARTKLRGQGLVGRVCLRQKGIAGRSVRYIDQRNRLLRSRWSWPCRAHGHFILKGRRREARCTAQRRRVALRLHGRGRRRRLRPFGRLAALYGGFATDGAQDLLEPGEALVQVGVRCLLAPAPGRDGRAVGACQAGLDARRARILP